MWYKNSLFLSKSDEPNAVIANWMRNRNTIEYLGIWEQLYNPDFKPTEFEGFRMQAGLNAFTLSPKKWIEATGAIGIVAKSGRYGGTYAHKDIAFKFASWISVEFELYIVKEFQRLKTEEQRLLGWSAKPHKVHDPCKPLKKFLYRKKSLIFLSAISLCDPRGARTHDPNIKSVVLYQLS